MDRIRALKPEVYNLIAAGEVVENPAGAVKELVENSIDAGARRITIEVWGGGFDQIIVSDDGHGIAEEDVELAFARYATSKLQSAEDLFGIQSLGFRGEALSSIAAVSRVKLTTCLRGHDVGVSVSVENGVVKDKRAVSANSGTTIEVRDLYYNAPVRKKFLKNAAGEKAYITKFVAKLILTNPNVAITYRADDKTVYSSGGNGLDEAIFAVYGGDCLSNCIPINYAQGNLRITGYAGTPEYSKANKNYQTLSVNGRCVSDNNVSGAIAQAYKSFLMTQKFPFFVLNVEIPAGDVNVNVHPKKSEVRFTNSSYICGQFYHAVQNALQNYSDARADSIFAEMRTNVGNEPSLPKFGREEVAKKLEQMEEEGSIQTMNPGQREDVLAIERMTEEADREREFEEFVQRMQREVTVANARRRLGFDETPPAVQQETAFIARQEPVPPVPLAVEQEKCVEERLIDRTHILGIAFNTYLILDFEEKVIFVDQHAAHERLLFNKFMQEATKNMQSLAVPYVFTVSDDEAQFIKENLENIFTAGIEVEEFGHNTFRITAVSELLVNSKMEDFVNFLLSSVDEFRLDNRTLIVEAIAKKACKAAVKAGQRLDEYEIEYILHEIRDNKILQCPHGRPITVVFTKTQIEKMFKRIV